MKKINLGCGDYPLEGFINIDIYEGKGVDLGCNILNLPFEDNSIDEIYCGHCIEHLTLEEAKNGLKEWLRVLKKDGKIGIVVPEKDLTPKNMIDGEEIPGKPYKKHHSYWDLEMLKKEVDEAGFKNIETIDINTYPYLVARPKWQVGITASKEVKINPKVLLATPIYDGKEYITSRYLKRISELSYKNYEILLIDTSKNIEFAQKIKAMGFNIVKLQYEEDTKIALTNARNYIRDYLLEKDYDYFFSLEQDLIPPKDIIEQLLVHDKEVVGGWYYITKVPRPCLSREWTMINMQFAPVAPLMEDMGREKLMKVFLGSFGCVLIKRSVLEKIKFKVYFTFPHHDDTWFYFDCERLGIGVYVDTDLLIPHFQDYKWGEIFDKNLEYETKKIIPKELSIKYNEIKLN